MPEGGQEKGVSRVVNIKLQEIIDDKEMTQRGLSELTGIRQASINAMCTNSAHSLVVENMEIICEVLGCDFSDIVELIPIEDAHQRHTKSKKRVQARINAEKNRERE